MRAVEDGYEVVFPGDLKADDEFFRLFERAYQRYLDACKVRPIKPRQINLFAKNFKDTCRTIMREAKIRVRDQQARESAASS